MIHPFHLSFVVSNKEIARYFYSEVWDAQWAETMKLGLTYCFLVIS